MLHRGHLGTWRHSPPQLNATDEAVSGTLRRDALLHVISLAKLHCRWVSSRGHMRISVDCDSKRTEDHSLNTTTQKRPYRHWEAAAFVCNTQVCRLGKRLTWSSTLSFPKLFVLQNQYANTLSIHLFIIGKLFAVKCLVILEIMPFWGGCK